MSIPDSKNQPGGPYRKPRADLYTVLLILSLIAILMGILCLYGEMSLYDFKFRGFQGSLSVSADAPIALAMVDAQHAASAAVPELRTPSVIP